MIYIYYSLTQKYFFDIKIKQISKEFLKEKIDNTNFFCLNAEECNGFDIINLCSDSFLFGNENKRVIVVKNAFFFNDDRNAKDFLILINFFKKKENNKNIILFFFVYEDDINKKNIFYKECKNGNFVFESFSFKEYEWKRKVVIPLINQKKITICEEAIKILSDRTKKDFASLINETNKLQLYRENISLELAEKIINASIEDNFFYFFNALIKKEKCKSIKILNDILKNKKILPNILLTMLINNFRFLYMCNFLSKNKNNYVFIAKKLKSNEIRTKLALQNIKNIENNNIIKSLNNLYLIDRNTKNGKINCTLAIELFIIRWFI